jgi:transcriptional regulator with XRE-family HTH domain
MPENSRGIAPLNWSGLVAEALRRRKAEKLTQREHAELASVSVPTIVAFDRGETTLSLAKAFDILRVIGLIEESKEGGAQEAFAQHAFERWRELTTKLPPDSPGRFSNGYYRLDYALEGEIKEISLPQLRQILREIVVRSTGWPLFLFLGRPEVEPREIDGDIECWVKPDTSQALNDPAHCDFWRVSPSGRAFIIRGYQEDSQETFAPRTIFDTTLPIWRIGECILHAERLANRIAVDPGATKIKFRALYTGLSGRVLRPWANPHSSVMFEGGASRSDEAVLETTIPVAEVASRLAEHLHPLIASLDERFGVTGLSVDRVAAEIERLRSQHFNRERS